MDERNSLLETKVQRKLRLSRPDEELMHYGVKGMRWGVRKDGKPQGYSQRRNIKKISKLDAKVKARAAKAKEVSDEWSKENKAQGGGKAPTMKLLTTQARVEMAKSKLNKATEKHEAKLKESRDRQATAKAKAADQAEEEWVNKVNNSQVDIINKTADIINPKFEAFNADPRWKGMDLDNNENGKVEKAYIDAYNKMHVESMNQAIKELGLNNSPKGATITYREPPKGSEAGQYYVDVKEPTVKHASDRAYEELYLKHYGVKGMKWGVRRTQRQLDIAAGRKPSKRTSKKVNKVSQKLEKKKAALAEKERKKNPTKGMSDTELRSELNRMQMERQYAQLTKTEKSSGRKAAETIFVATATTSAASLVKSGYKKAGEKVFNKLSGETAAKAAVDRMVKGAS